MKASFLLPLLLTLATSAHAQAPQAPPKEQLLGPIRPEGLGNPVEYHGCFLNPVGSNFLKLTADPNDATIKFYRADEPKITQPFTSCVEPEVWNIVRGKPAREYWGWNITVQKTPDSGSRIYLAWSYKMGARPNALHQMLVLRGFTKGPNPIVLVHYGLRNGDLDPLLSPCSQGGTSYRGWLALDNPQFDLLDSVTVEASYDHYFPCIQ